MADQATTNARSKGVQNVFQVARALYGAAFEPKSRARVGEAMADWSELSEEERSFTLGHLLYLNLYAQASTLRVLREIRDGLEDIDDAIQAVADEVVRDGDGDESEGGEEPTGDGDGYFGEGDGADGGEGDLEALSNVEAIDRPGVNGPNTTNAELEASHGSEELVGNYERIKVSESSSRLADEEVSHAG